MNEIELNNNRLINATKQISTNMKKRFIENIIKIMRFRNLRQFAGMHDMLVCNDAWIMPRDANQEPIKLSEIKSIDSLILIIELLCYNPKLSSSTKLSVFENIVKKKAAINFLE